MKERRHFADRMADHARLGTVGRLAPWCVSVLRAVLGPIAKVAFRPEMHGWSHLPDDRPVLIVSNHSGGGGAEILCLVWLWLQRFGGERAVTGMAHPAAFFVPGMAVLLRGLGAIPATYRHAEEAFRENLSVIVFPGGDHEAFRPFWKANHVDFARRRGFLRLARKANVAIVPMGIQGSHLTKLILWRSRLFAWLCVVPRLFGVKRVGLSLIGVVGGLAIFFFVAPVWGYAAATALALLWVGGPLALLMPLLPWKVRIRMGPPMEPEDLFDESDQEESLVAAYDRVVAEVQRLVLESSGSG